jgi:leucyl-tRNA synthetase
LYSPNEIEQRWQNYWRENRTTAAEHNSNKPKYFILDMFPYPSGEGLHVGHPLGYAASDIVSRFYRMNGYNVLHPMGFDAFGLPTERQAMEEQQPPEFITERNIATFTKQLDSLAFDYDWSQQVITSQPEYYRWTQWMFLQIYNAYYCTETNKAKPIEELPIPQHISNARDIDVYRDSHRLAYTAEIPVNWCEALGTVLANEEVDEWKNKGYTVVRRPMKQWMMRITAYSERLSAGLDTIQWPQSTKEMQKHWIGKSEGASIVFALVGTNASVEVFTTRPDTLFGATYLVLAPEHPLVAEITTNEQRASVTTYQGDAASKSDLERTGLNKSKSGINTGGRAINPATGDTIPVWIADYVLAHYGTGAIMAVPAHDERDYEFAVHHGLPIVQVVQAVHAESTSGQVEPELFTEDGISVHSTSNHLSLTGLPTAIAKEECITWLESTGTGKRTIQYRLRDWLFSRQRYWGEPIPIMYFDDGTKRCCTDDELPLRLPKVHSFMPAGTGESPLALVEEWVNFIDPKTGKRARYETNTMPQWAGSCWYYLRYADPQNPDWFCSEQRQRYWLGENGVDLYIGGAEHAVLHLLYARFWHKVLYDLGHVFTEEPFQRLFHQGMIQAEDGQKMSKSLKNTIDPLSVIAQVGADALRVYLMFLGPLEQSKPWSSRGIEGTSRFLQRLWRLICTETGEVSESISAQTPTPEDLRVLHTTIKKVRDDIASLSFNTPVAQFMIAVNYFTTQKNRNIDVMSALLQCIAPFAPHITEELWWKLGKTSSIHQSTFPAFREEYLVEAEHEILVQINSKIRKKLLVPAGMTADAQQQCVLADAEVQQWLEGGAPKKIISVPGKLVNVLL